MTSSTPTFRLDEASCLNKTEPISDKGHAAFLRDPSCYFHPRRSPFIAPAAVLRYRHRRLTLQLSQAGDTHRGSFLTIRHLPPFRSPAIPNPETQPDKTLPPPSSLFSSFQPQTSHLHDTLTEHSSTQSTFLPALSFACACFSPLEGNCHQASRLRERAPPGSFPHTLTPTPSHTLTPPRTPDQESN